MKILIVPTIREIYKNQFEYCTDLRLINLLEKTFVNSRVEIYNNSITCDYNLIVISGGNNHSIKKNRDKIRNQIDNKIYNFAIKNSIKILGICHGAQFIAKKFKFKLEKKKNHIGNHEIIIKFDSVKLKKKSKFFSRRSHKDKKIQKSKNTSFCER